MKWIEALDKICWRRKREAAEKAKEHFKKLGLKTKF